MAKQIITIIKSCHDCPHLDYGGGFTPGGAKSLCRKKNKARELPRAEPTYRNGVPKRAYDHVIPKWCPLDEMPTKNKED